ncbi:MAG: competence protein TfoX, partial [Butyricicoccus pullicaecorum]|nr:competence protein TfoX [Butyricicoccus pullicaecorum]
MATSKEYQMFIQEQLAPTGDISMRAMMGEYDIYYKDKVIGGLYDN